MKNKVTLFAVILISILSIGFCMKNKFQSKGNLEKAYEIFLQAQNESKAMELVEKELVEFPGNVQAFLFRAWLNREKGEYDKAMQDINNALKLNDPKKTGVRMSTLYWCKGSIYKGMADWDNAVALYGTAYMMAKTDGNEKRLDIASVYAQALCFTEDYDGADAIFREILAEDETNQWALVGIARNMIIRGDSMEAVRILDKCQINGECFSQICLLKMQAYTTLEEIPKAIDAGLDWFDKSGTPIADVILGTLSEQPEYAEASLKSRAAKSEKPYRWKLLLAQLYETVHKYVAAVETYNEMESEFGCDAQINCNRSDCLSELGLNDLAIADISKLLEQGPDCFYLCLRGDYYRLSGDLDAAIADFTGAIIESPNESYAYYKRGWCFEMQGNLKRALEDYNSGLNMEDSFPYLHLMRGELLLMTGKKEEADADFEEVIQKDTIALPGSCRQYALHFLGRDKEAVRWMDRIIENAPEADGAYYDKACLYSRMWRLTESVAALQTAFEKGYRSFSHIRLDDDMDAIRDLPAFKALVKEYEGKHEIFKRDCKLIVPKEEKLLPYKIISTCARPDVGGIEG